MLNTADLASRFGLTRKALRRILREMTEYADGVRTNYEWHEDDPMIQKIATAVQKKAEGAMSRAEDLAANELVKFLQEQLPSRLVEARSNLLYRVTVDSEGEYFPKGCFDPSRGQNAFQVDIVIRKKKSGIPLVGVELKLGGFSTHDVLTYSSKAIRHKEIYPYLRYGLVIIGEGHITNKFFMHNVGFDFALVMPNTEAGRRKLLKLLKRQLIICSRLISISKEKKNQIRRYENIVRISTTA